MTFERSYWGDVRVTMHTSRALAFYCIVLIGTFLSPVLHYDRLALSLLATFFYLQLASYGIDEYKGRHCGTNLSNRHFKYRIAIGIIVSWLIAIYLALTIQLALILLSIVATILAIGYNYEVLSFHGRLMFAFGWAFYPLLCNYYLQSLSAPTLIVVMWGIVVMVFAYMHIVTYGNFGCRVKTCKDKPRDDCHGQACDIRRYGIMKESHALQKKIASLEILLLVVITLAVIVAHFGW